MQDCGLDVALENNIKSIETGSYSHLHPNVEVEQLIKTEMVMGLLGCCHGDADVRLLVFSGIPSMDYE